MLEVLVQKIPKTNTKETQRKSEKEFLQQTNDPISRAVQFDAVAIGRRFKGKEGLLQELLDNQLEIIWSLAAVRTFHQESGQSAENLVDVLVRMS